jgi:putative copper export protein
MIADTAHVIAAGGWVGGLLVVLAAGIPAALAGGSGRARRTAALINAFSPVAIVCAGTLVATGVFAAWLHVGSFGALVQSGYGQLLLLKLAAFLAVAGFGAWNFLRLKPRLTTTSAVITMRRSAASEIALGAIVLLVTAVLVATSPPVDSVDVAAGDGSSCLSTDSPHAGLTLVPCIPGTSPAYVESFD